MSCYRTGRKNGHTIYWQDGDEPTDDDNFLGSCVTPGNARSLVEVANLGVEVWRAGDRPVPPTRDQVEQARGAVAFLFHTMASPVNDARRKAYQDVKTVLDALSGGVPTEPEPSRTGCCYVFGPYSCVKRAGHDGEHLGSQSGEWVPTEPEETADGHD